jgi:cell division protein ZipA
MDADTLRLILIVVGAALVLALYLWERSRAEEQDDALLPLAEGERREPSVGYFDTLSEDSGEDEPQPNPAELKGKREAAAAASFQAASMRGAAMPEAAVHLVAEASQEPDADAPGGSNTLILQLGIRARGEEMRGPDILDAAARCGLRPGELGAFHHKILVSGNADSAGESEGEDEGEGDETRTLFSMVSMVKPGEFPFEAMEQFQTKGLLLFAVLDRGPDNLQVLDDMIAVARRLADEFDAEVLDERRQPLTPIMVEVLRARVLEFNRSPVAARR